MPRTVSSPTKPQKVAIGEGYYAFVPAPLPPALEYPETLVTEIHGAAAALGSVAAISRFVPNPRLLIVPFLSLEAVLSSRIEGTVTTPTAVLEARVAPEADVGEPTAEVRNYLDAMDYGLSQLPTLPLSLRLLRDLHALMMKNVRGYNRAPGEFRQGQVHIGSDALASARYIPPPANYVPDLMSNWERFLHSDALPPLVQCAVAHAQFEMIHPFWDGNGRIGRLFISLMLIAKGHLPQPLLFLSAYLERHREQYYDHLAEISSSGDWNPWVGFFMRAVTAQASAAANAAKALLDLRDTVRHALTTRSIHALTLLDILFEAPVVTVGLVQDRLNVQYPSARRAIDALVKVGFLDQMEHKRPVRFMASPIFDVLDSAAAEG